MCMTFASLAWCHMTFLLSLFFCFHPQYLKLLICVSSPQGIPPHILPAIHLLTSLLLFGAFVIVALMYADSDCWTIFSLSPLLSALSPLLLWLAFTFEGISTLLPFVKGRWGPGLLVFSSMPTLLLELLLMLAALTRGSEAAQCCYGEAIKIDLLKCSFYFKSHEMLLCQFYVVSGSRKKKNFGQVELQLKLILGCLFPQ